MFKCSICKKTFDRKFNYDRHITSKHNCVYKEDDDGSNEEEQNYINLLECEHCKKTYSTKFNLNKHIKKCSILSKKNDVIEQKETLYKERISHL